MDDIKNKRSLREVLPGKANQEESPLRNDIKPMFTVPEPAPITNKIPRRPSTMPVKAIIASIVVVLVVIGGIVASTAFAKATINVTPRQADIVLDGSTTFTAVSTPIDDQSLVFGTVSKEFTESKNVAATGETQVSEKASGTIIVYNNVDEKPFKLLATTRFETTDGKIYRTKEAVSVPGMRGATPGALEVMVYADQPGVDYNIGLTDFKLPGLKSDAVLYGKVYARSKTPMTGGFVGTTKSISTVDRTAAETELKQRLTSKTTSPDLLEIPAGHILLPGTNTSTFSSLKIEKADNPNDAKVSMTLSYTGVLLKQTDLAKFLAQKYVPEYKGEPVDIESAENLSFILSTGSSTAAKIPSEISFAVKGNTRLIWTFDELALKEALKGLSKSTYSDKLGAFPAIQKSSISFRPLWIFSIPDDITKIEIKKEVSSPAK